jgi:membrane fusion protein, heavy metal efflux system
MSQFNSLRHDPVAPQTAQVPTAAPQAEPTQKMLTRRDRLRAALPIALVFSLLLIVAFWGHSTDWSFGFSSSSAGENAANASACVVDGEAWCKEHNVPEAICIECNKKLVPPLQDYGWCAEHGVAQCPLDHPDIAQLNESPQITPDDIQRADRALALLPRSENSSRCKHYQSRIQFASLDAIDKAGVDIAVADQAPILEAITANGEIVYDQTHLAHLSSRVTGTVSQVAVQVGQQVHRGDVLALIDSTEIGKAKAELLQSISALRLKRESVARLQPLTSDGAVPGKQLREAEAALQEAQIHLLSAQQTLTNLGMPVDLAPFEHLSTEQIGNQIQFLGVPASFVSEHGINPTSNLFPLRSPLDGIVVDCKIVPGEAVDSTATIFSVADLTHMWLVLDVRQEDAGHISLGQPVLFQASDTKGEQVKGTVAWISTETDDKTRTVKVRVDLPNPDRKLRANTFGTGRIVMREEPKATVIPTEAVHTDGDCNIVFVRDKNFLHDGAPKFFHIREVRVGVQDGNNTEIIAGLLPGEVVAAKNSMVLEAQLLKSNLGEGCACCAPSKK